MLIDDNGTLEGSVTGGCVEGALVEVARSILAGGEPSVETFGISDELAGSVGLMCGGTVRVSVSELQAEDIEVLDAVRGAVNDGRPTAIATLLDGEMAGRRLAIVEGEVLGRFGGADLLDHSVGRDASGLLDHGVSMIRRYGHDGATMGEDLRVFVESFAVPPRLVIFGAIDFSVSTAWLAGGLGYEVTICDAREPFIRSPRFSDVAEVVVDWPDRYLDTQKLNDRDVVLVFTHDPKFDEPALIAALRSGAGFVGALGSRRTHAGRVERLRENGVSEEDIARISAPCGLDIGASTPIETAVSILAEIIATRAKRRGEPLSRTSGPIRHVMGVETMNVSSS
jgi:xanthine dehydrogenase accessory factor